MLPLLDPLLPSLPAFASPVLWFLAGLAMLEATILVGLLVPGMLVIFAAGMAARFGPVDLADLVWFAAAGTALGGMGSFLLGRRAPRGGGGLMALTDPPGRAACLLGRHGGAAIVLGRFRGPLSGSVSFLAAAAGMGAGRFLLWNLLGAVLHAVLLAGLGHATGQALAALGAAASRSVAFGAAALAMLTLLWLLLRHVRRAIPPLLGAGAAIRDAVGRMPMARAAVARHPRLAGFLVQRFGTEKFLGLTATVLGVLFLYVATVWANSAFDFLGDASVVTTDTRMANLLYGMRDPRLVSILGWITDAGGRHGVLPMLAGVSVALLVLHRYDLFGGLWIAAVGNQLTVTLLKALFDRPRSVLGYFVETSGSFPSGHAAAAVAVWAMLFYLGWRLRVLRARVAAAGAATVAFAIGLSRVYLVEHYLSDVLNGYLVGGLWLILGVAFCEWRRGARPAPSPARRRVAGGVVTAAGGVVIWLATVTATPLNPQPQPDLPILADAGRLLTGTALPRVTETLTGVPRQRVNLIVTAADPTRLSSVLVDDGWSPAPHPGPGLLAIAAFDDWTGRPLPDPLVVPTFWNDRPSGLAFTRPAGGGRRLHLRLWDSEFRTGAGDVVFAATLTEEDPLAWVFDDDAESPGRDVAAPLGQIAAALRAAGFGVDMPR